MSADDKNERFLNRWSLRKVEASSHTSAPTEREPEDDQAPQATAISEEAGRELADVPADLPDIDSLDKDSDYTVFLKDGVPEEIRTLALRKLWRSDPVLANLDGLNDYDEDFGEILKSGAAYMRKLAEAGEKFTRPGADRSNQRDAADTGDVASDASAQDAEDVAEQDSAKAHGASDKGDDAV